MSIAVMSAVWERSTAKEGALLVLLAIADFADDDGCAWPGLEKLARKARLSKRQVIRIVHALEESGELRVDRAKTRDRGPSRNRVNRYTVVLKKGAAPASFLSDSDVVSPTTGVESDIDDQRTVTLVSPESSVEPSVKSVARSKEKQIPSAQHLVAFFVDRSRALGSDPPRQTVGQAAQRIGALLAEGQSEAALRRGIERMLERRLSPTLLANCVHEASLNGNGARPEPRPRLYTEVLAEQAAESQAELDAYVCSRHRPEMEPK